LLKRALQAEETHIHNDSQKSGSENGNLLKTAVLHNSLTGTEICFIQ